MNYVENAFAEAAETLQRFQNSKAPEELQKAINIMVETFKSGNHVFSCGNGGSMCDAMHFAEELTGRYRKDRKPLPAVAINDPSYMTCVSNDYGAEHVFSRYVEGWGKQGDCLLAISTSGNSTNVIEAVKVAKAKGLKVIGLLGKGGGQLVDLTDISIIVDSKVTDRIQEVHIKCIHTLIEGIERSLFPENYSS